MAETWSHRFRASQCDNSAMSHARSSKFQKSDRHSNWIEVETAFYYFGWKGWRNATPLWRHSWPGHPRCIPVHQVIILPSKSRPLSLLTGQFTSKCDCEWLRKVKGYSEEVTACFIACFGRLWYCERPECANPHHMPVSRSSWNAVSRNPKAENRNYGIFTRRYQAESTGFPVYVGAQHAQATERLACIALGWISLGSSRCVECIVKALGYWMVNNSMISSAHNALLGCFVLRVQAKRMKSRCLLYLILEQKSYAFQPETSWGSSADPKNYFAIIYGSA